MIARASAILRPPIITVTVKAGDSLGAIAAAHRLTLKALLAFPEEVIDEHIRSDEHRDIIREHAAYFTGSIARTIVPSRSTYAVADGPLDPVRLA